MLATTNISSLVSAALIRKAPYKYFFLQSQVVLRYVGLNVYKNYNNIQKQRSKKLFQFFSSLFLFFPSARFAFEEMNANAQRHAMRCTQKKKKKE
jgi:hypothetical protein